MAHDQLLTMLPMLFVAGLDRGVVGLLAVVLTLLRDCDLSELAARAAEMLARFRRFRMSFVLTATYVSHGECGSTDMSAQFRAVAWHVHCTLRDAPPGSPVWTAVRCVKELPLNRRSLVANVFDGGSYVDDQHGVRVAIDSRPLDAPPGKKDGGDVDVLARTEWSIALSAPTAAHIRCFVDACVAGFDRSMDELSHSSRQTLYVATSVARVPGSHAHHVHYADEDFQSTKTFDNVFFPGKDALLAKLDRFERGEAEYKRIGKPWKLYMMFHGKSGAGKTSCVKAIANRTGKHVVLLRMDKFPHVAALCDEITRFAADQSIPYHKLMFVVEEFDRCDGFADGPAAPPACLDLDKGLDAQLRKLLAARPEGPPSARSLLGTMLTTFDGIKELHGCTIVFTTNNVERFDPALTRPGRIDKVEFELLGAEEIEQYWRLYFDEPLPAITGIEGRRMSVSDLVAILELGRDAAARELEAWC